MIPSFSVRREEYLIASAIQSAVLAADTAYCANSHTGEVEINAEGMKAIQQLTAIDVSVGQLLNLRSILDGAIAARVELDKGNVSKEKSNPH